MANGDIRAAETLKRVIDPGRPLRGVEIGIFAGETSREFLLRPNVFLYMVDNYRSKEEQPEAYKASGDYHANRLGRKEQDDLKAMAEKATEFAQDRRMFLIRDSIIAAQQFEDRSLDFAFIDADHSYEGAHPDVEAWWPKIAPGGVLGGHDYDLPTHPHFGVKRAVDEAVEKYGWKLELGENYTWFVKF